MLWPVVALIVSGIAVVVFLRWYYQAHSQPGNTSNPKLVAMFNERLDAAVSRLTPAHARGLSPAAADSARTFLLQVREVSQHCQYAAHVTVHNRVVFDLTLNDGSVTKGLYSGGQRCPSADVPGVPILRIRLNEGHAAEVTSNGSERQAPPAEVVPALDSLIKHLIGHDQGLRPGAYFAAATSPTDLQQAWAEPTATKASQPLSPANTATSRTAPHPPGQ
ncbi:MAG: hypothetical protein IPO19_14690 [Rhodoferax sp.]|nr:hypothetical protein [Rhodoferax sp.]